MNHQQNDLILIIDDNATNIRVLLESLEEHGYTVITALNGTMGIRRAKFSQPDLILLDVMMPGIDGFETCQRLKADENTQDIPVIFMTALDDVDNKVKGFNLGGVDYITKPFEEAEVLARVQSQLTICNLQKQSAQQLAELQRVYNHMHQDLILAQEVQRTLLPPVQPNWPDLDVYCYTASAREVGGDFYIYHSFELPLDLQSNQESGSYMVAVGDISGKGMPAALIMSVSLTLLQASFKQELSPQELLSYLDETLQPYTKPKRQNCALVCVELSRGSTSYTLRFANGGCIPPYIRRADGPVEFEEIGGFALGQGLSSRLGYQQHTMELFLGDMVILTSDGVVEANNEAGDMLGFEQLEQIIREFSSKEHLQGTTSLEGVGSAEDMLNYLKEAVFAFTGEAEQHDDMTMVVIKV